MRLAILNGGDANKRVAIWPLDLTEIVEYPHCVRVVREDKSFIQVQDSFDEVVKEINAARCPDFYESCLATAYSEDDPK